MRPGQLTPENYLIKLFFSDFVGASMRPGQLIPENQFQQLHWKHLFELLQ